MTGQRSQRHPTEINPHAKRSISFDGGVRLELPCKSRRLFSRAAEVRRLTAPHWPPD